MNNWESVAAIFNLKLEEEFKIKDSDYVYKFTETGLKAKSGEEWIYSLNLSRLLSGEREIDRPWKPKCGENYYFVHISVEETQYRKSGIDLVRLKEGNFFQTVEEADDKADRIREFRRLAVENHES